MNKKRKGFTLVELIVVMAVLLVLSVLAVMAYSDIQETFRRSARVSDAGAIARSINTYNSACAPGNIIIAHAAVAGVSAGLPAITGTAATSFLFPLQLDTTDSDLLDMNLSVTLEGSRWNDRTAQITTAGATSYLRVNGTLADGNLIWSSQDPGRGN